MTDYIRRDVAINELCRRGCETERSGKLVVSMCEAKQFAVDVIGDVPAADVRENIHAEWLHVQLPLPLSDSSKSCVQCSNCLTHWDEDCEFRYCPYCGAQMG